jgi:hypothetical protein
VTLEVSLVVGRWSLVLLIDSPLSRPETADSRLKTKD